MLLVLTDTHSNMSEPATASQHASHHDDRQQQGMQHSIDPDKRSQHQVRMSNSSDHASCHGDQQQQAM